MRLASSGPPSRQNVLSGAMPSREVAQTMATLLPYIIYHEGDNAGFRSVLVFAIDARVGIAVMTNGEGRRPLIPEVRNALFRGAGRNPFRSAD